MIKGSTKFFKYDNIMDTTEENFPPKSEKDHAADINLLKIGLPECSRSFCSMTNIGSSVLYLNQELQNLGLRYKLIEANGMKLNLVSLVNSCWDVIQMYHAMVKDGNALHDHRQRELADLNHLQISIKSLKTDIESKDRLVQDAQEKERQISSMNKALASKLKADKDEIRRLNGILQQRESHQQHIIRKKEAEIAKLQERLHRLVSGDRGTETKIHMTGSLNRSDKARGRWRTDNSSMKHEEELYRKVLSQYETWVGQLTDEGDQLKECLASFALRISKIATKCLTSQQNLLSDVELLDGSITSPIYGTDHTGEDPIFSLDFRSVREQIQKRLDSSFHLIELSLHKKECNEEPVNLFYEEDIDNTNEVVGSEKLAETIFDNTLTNTIELLTESQQIEKEQDLKQEMRAVKEEKKKLQKERENFAIAAIRLNREKANFEAEKVELLRYQFLEDLPSSLRNYSKEPFTPNTSMEISPNQSLPDLYGDSPKTLLSMPCLTSPTGNIIKTGHPITIGTPKTQQHRESGSRSRTLRSQVSLSSLGGKSAPATRNSSMNRREDLASCSEFRKARTLDRPRLSRTSCLSTLSLYSGKKIISPDRSSNHSARTFGTDSSPIHQHPQSISHVCLASSSADCAYEQDERQTSKRYSTDLSENGENYSMFLKPSSKTWSGQRFLGLRSAEFTDEDYLTSVDSGFSYEDAETSSSVSVHPRDAQTNYRLEALESSLGILLDQIKSRSQIEKPASAESVLPVGLINQPLHSYRLDSGEVFLDEFGKQNDLLTTRNFNPPSTSTSVQPVILHKERNEAASTSHRVSRLASAPGSLASSRKSSQDRRPGEDYLKKLQNSFTKWYFKSS